MTGIRYLEGIEILKRLDEKLHIYYDHILVYSKMEWKCEATPRWILGIDMVEKLNVVFGNIPIYNGLQGVLESVEAEGIVCEDGKAILVRIKHCVECPFAFGYICSVGDGSWVEDIVLWEASGYLTQIPKFCPLQRKHAVDIEEYMMENDEKKSNLGIHPELREIRDIILKLLADLKAVEDMDLGETIGDQAEIEIIKGLITKAVNGVVCSLQNCRPENLPKMMIVDLFQEIPEMDLGDFLNQIYQAFDEVETEEANEGIITDA